MSIPSIQAKQSSAAPSSPLTTKEPSPLHAASKISGLVQQSLGSSSPSAIMGHKEIAVVASDEKVETVAHQILPATTVTDKISTFLPPFINLLDSPILLQYIDPRYRKDVELCRTVATKIYEADIRAIINAKYGMAFPTEPEVLAYAMQRVKNQTVVELGGASGENAILLAFAGAGAVYMNDIDLDEIRQFRESRSQLPNTLQQKLIPVHGSCFDLLVTHPALRHKVGLVLYRNLIHFFNDQQQAQFFAIIKELLTPDGKAIFTINSKYVFARDCGRLFDGNPDATCFAITQVLLVDNACGTRPIAILDREVSVCSDDAISCDYERVYLYERQLGEKWTVYNANFQRLPAQIRPKIKQVIERSKKTISSIQSGHVRVLTSTQRLYSLENLNVLFKKYGFDIEHAFIAKKNGHITTRTTDGQQIGAIVKIQA